MRTTCFDGSFLDWMFGAAADAGFPGIGLAGHCTISDRPGFDAFKFGLHLRQNETGTACFTDP